MGLQTAACAAVTTHCFAMSTPCPSPGSRASAGKSRSGISYCESGMSCRTTMAPLPPDASRIAIRYESLFKVRPAEVQTGKELERKCAGLTNPVEEGNPMMACAHLQFPCDSEALQH